MCFFTPPAGTKRVHNNIVYNEYISDREHVHMNSTQWETLTDFTKWLGREGKLRRSECIPNMKSIRTCFLFFTKMWKSEGNLFYKTNINVVDKVFRKMKNMKSCEESHPYLAEWQ